MRYSSLSAVCTIALAVGLAASPAAGQPVLVAGVSTVAGIDVACTGVGESREDPRWLAYPVRLEFSDARTDYLAGVEVSVADPAGHTLLSLRCEDGPWLLLGLSPGRYRVDVRLTTSPAQPRSVIVQSPAQGQARVVVQFPDA